jgi:biotin transport system substrate-specific component
MNNPISAATAGRAFVPLRLADRPLALRAAVVALGTLFLAASSWVEVPMIPVPMTMQTFAVTLIGALYGWRLGAITVLAWLGEAVVGLPVLAGGAGGIAHFAGPTAGYLFAFPLAAALVGWLAERGWTGNGKLLRSFVAMLLGNAFILVMGGAWLAALIGVSDAITYGVTPFVLGAIVKSALATASVEATRRAGKSKA